MQSSETQRPYGDVPDDELETLLDDAFQFRDWTTVELIQDEFNARYDERDGHA